MRYELKLKTPLKLLYSYKTSINLQIKYRRNFKTQFQNCSIRKTFDTVLLKLNYWFGLNVRSKCNMKSRSYVLNFAYVF